MASASKVRKVDLENRKFNEKWTSSYFFVESGNSALCLLCNQSITTIKEFNLKRHFDSKHGFGIKSLSEEQKLKKIESLKESVTRQKNLFTKQDTTAKAATLVSYEIAHIIAKKKKPFSDGDYIKECLSAFSKYSCPEKKAKVEEVSLSRNTITRRIEEISEHLVEKLHECATKFQYFSLALDESCDISDTAQLSVFVRGIFKDFTIHEEFLALCPMKGTTTGDDIFNELLRCCETFELNWKKFSGASTDGCPSMVGKKRGVCQRILNFLSEKDIPVNPVIFVHCIVHREALCAKILTFPDVMSKVVKNVNLIRSRGLNHREFQSFLADLEADYPDVIYFAETRWLSRGKTLKRFYELREIIAFFLESKGIPNNHLSDKSWLCDLAFLVDMNDYLIVLNLQLQGQNQLFHKLVGYIQGFMAKLGMWEAQLKEGNLTNFPTLLSQTKSSLKAKKYAKYVGDLKSEFECRFLDLSSYQSKIEMFVSPFQVDASLCEQNCQNELLELQNDFELKSLFDPKDLRSFYKQLSPEAFPNLIENALRLMSLFGSTYVCEKFFSDMKFNKSKERNRLSDEHLQAQLRISNSSIPVNVIDLVKEKPFYQKSH